MSPQQRKLMECIHKEPETTGLRALSLNFYNLSVSNLTISLAALV